MNLGTMQTAVYARMGLDVNDGLITPTVVAGFINEANHVIEQESDWPWLEAKETLSLTANADSYSPVSALWLRTRWISNDVNRVVEWYSRQELDDRWQSGDVGKPIEFSVFADKIVFRPVPDTTYSYTHYFQQAEPELAISSDTPLMPATFHNSIVEYATYLGFRASRETERATEAFQAYEDRLKRMKERAKRAVDRPGRVRVRPGGML